MMTTTPCMIAHRGYSGKYPPNTESAFVMAAAHGSGGAETDIRRTKDGVYVCSHDGDVDYADGTNLIVADSTFEELTSKPLLNRTNDETAYLCSYRRYLEIMRQSGMVCFIELKGPYTEDQVKEVFDIAAEVYDLRKCILQSFDFDNLLRCRELFPELPLMYTYGTGESHYERCFDHGIAIDADRVILTPAMVSEFHAHGLEVGVWTVNSEDDLRKFADMGVDYIESDIFGGRDVQVSQ